MCEIKRELITDGSVRSKVFANKPSPSAHSSPINRDKGSQVAGEMCMLSKTEIPVRSTARLFSFEHVLTGADARLVGSSTFPH